MRKKFFDFLCAARLVRAYSTELFSLPLFGFYCLGADDGRTFSELLTEAYYVYLGESENTRCMAEGAADRALALVGILTGDMESIFLSDPTATSREEVLTCYPGFFAIVCHRLAHVAYTDGMYTLARFISEYAHSLTGIDIHPGATVGERFSIDHGTGVVIGETATIGKDVKIYQGVTIGAKSFPRDENGNFDKTKKRHPTICDGCTVYAGATILGGDTVVGEGSVIGANVWLTSSVAAGSVIYYGRK